MNIEDIRQCCRDESVFLTAHGTIRLYDRRISYDSVITAIMNGEIIEEYPDDYPFPSCLISAIDPYPLHVVCGLGNGQVFIITAYKPDSGMWEADNKTRKER
jgi:hypothetical protein